MTTLEDIKRWKENGIRLGASHVIVVCDTFEYEDYPVYAYTPTDLEEKKSRYNGPNMQKIMEVITL
jgi:hypothetical protein